jgi:hypothetical protein
MICLGEAQMSPGKWDSQAAQLWIVWAFREYFMKKFPSGIVISELEYMSRTTSAPKTPMGPSGPLGPLQVPGRSKLNQILDALTLDFRRWSKERDYRKCDVLGIANDGLNAELVEVTTEDNARSAIIQINAKVATLRETVNRIHNMSVDWRASEWKPGPSQLFRVVKVSRYEIKYICYMPTFRALAPPGVVLYEIHVIERPPDPVRVPVPEPEGVRERIRELVPLPETMEERARRFLTENPDVADWIRAIALLMALGSVLLAIVAIIDPVPGDEIAAFAFASALFRFAMQR